MLSKNTMEGVAFRDILHQFKHSPLECMSFLHEVNGHHFCVGLTREDGDTQVTIDAVLDDNNHTILFFGKASEKFAY